MRKPPRKDDRDNEARNALSQQLFEAVAAKDLALARTLLEAGADVNHRDIDTESVGKTNLIVAIGNEDKEMMHLLFEYGADPELYARHNAYTPISYAVFTENLEVIQNLIEHGASVNSQSGNAGTTPLMDAIYDDMEDRQNQEAIIHLLLSKGADPWAKDYDGIDFITHAQRGNWPLPPEIIEAQIKAQSETLASFVGDALKKWLKSLRR